MDRGGRLVQNYIYIYIYIWKQNSINIRISLDP